MSPANDDSSEWETFPHAPIVEAVVDLRASLPSSVTADTLATLHDRIRGDFPHRETQVELAATVVFAGGAPAASGQQRPHGFRFLTEDRKWIFQARLDGFTVSHLAPYTDWKNLRICAAGLWEHYLAVANPLAVERVGLRYINRIFIPLGASLSDYFELEPRLGPDLPQNLAWFGVQVAMEDPDVPAVVVIQQRRDADSPAHPSQAPIVLDIDVFREWRLDPRSDEVWSLLDSLRNLKNKMFFNATTAKAKEMFR
ncbi:MAG TPA: TIGR04255 family protein [Polyangiaceae bacterium]|jgi:uncharacterized protein (TIGR04255 family)|nr:TIGR04255 family protein [Polyangiaceae bacterium]